MQGNVPSAADIAEAEKIKDMHVLTIAMRFFPADKLLEADGESVVAMMSVIKDTNKVRLNRWFGYVGFSL